MGLWLIKHCLLRCWDYNLFIKDLNSHESANNMYLSSFCSFQSAFLYPFLLCFLLFLATYNVVVAQSFMDGTQVYHINVGEGRCIHLNPPGDGTLAKTDYLLLFHKENYWSYCYSNCDACFVVIATNIKINHYWGTNKKKVIVVYPVTKDI